MNNILELYSVMQRIRLVEKEIADNYNNEIREMHTPIHLCDGEEAIAVGVCTNLKQDDVIFSNHRCHGHYLAKGGSLDALISELHNKEAGCCRGKGGSMHLCDLVHGIMLTSAIVAGNVSIATGYALAQKIKKSSAITAVFFGDGASEEGSVYESISYAAQNCLPVLFVCENNRVAISTPFQLREPKENVKGKFESIIPSFIVDGNDVEEVHRVSSDIIDQIRDGEGPFFLECTTYRLRAHSNVGNGVDGKYRSEEELAYAKQKDPLVVAKNRLIRQGHTTESDLLKLDESIQSEIAEAFSKAREASLPKAKELYADVLC